MKLSKAEAWKIHRETAAKLVPSDANLAQDLARIAFAVNQKENRQLDPAAKNSASTARGMMQMLKGTQCEIAKKLLKEPCVYDDIFDPKVAIRYGQRYLLYQYKRYQDWHKAVHAYNQGSYAPTRKKAFAAGESYANSAMSFYANSDYAALDAQIGATNSGVVATTNSRTYSEWS